MRLYTRQVLIALVAFVAAQIVVGWMAIPLSFPLLAGSFAALFSILLKNPKWWHFLHAAFFPLIGLAYTLGLNPNFYLGAFAVTLLISVGAFYSRVPLYFSGNQQLNALSTLIDAKVTQVIDLGAGIGSVVHPLSRTFPKIKILAYEIAPLTFLIGYLRCLFQQNIHWYLRPFAQADLTNCDLAYAFLSTEPMPDLWLKVSREMRPGTLFVSNSFPVPTVEATDVLLPVSAHPLYVYKIPERAA